jgi:hypothetical protein
MDADLDLLLIAVYVTADDLLPERPGNARRSVTDAEVVTLCVAQAIMGIPSDRRFLRVASKHLRHLFPRIPGQAGYFKRRRRLTDTLEWLMSVFASQSPGFYDDLLLVDSTPVECARSRETVASPKRDEREVALELLARTRRHGGETLIGDKGYAGRAFAQAVSDMDATILRPRRKDEPGRGPHLAPIRQRIESIFWSCKGTHTLERHGARTLAGLRERILQRLLTLAAAVSKARGPRFLASGVRPCSVSSTDPRAREAYLRFGYGAPSAELLGGLLALGKANSCCELAGAADSTLLDGLVDAAREIETGTEPGALGLTRPPEPQ